MTSLPGGRGRRRRTSRCHPAGGRPVAALDPVVAGAADDRVDALTGDDEVVAGTGERLVVVGATVGEVLAVAAHDDVVADAAVDGVVAGTALEDVGAAEVGDDVVAVAAEGDVVAAAAFDDVVALVAQEGVVVVAALDAVGGGRAVVDGLAVDAGRIDAVDLAVLDRAVGHADQQCVLVAVRLVGSSTTVVPVMRARRRRESLPSSNLQSAVANESAFSVCAVGVAHDQLGERVALELGAQVHARRAGQVVEPVAVLQVLQLALEDVVERAAEQAAEQVGVLGEAADPQVDVVEAGDRVAPELAQAPVLNMKSAASGRRGRRVGTRIDDRSGGCRAFRPPSSRRGSSGAVP